ncbi:MAG: 16S rRNA (guanine(966)-N(2))-methyltransferase RsmD [Verrucomicrobiota bacterium]|nr:16S rRNA (guanine(966)-N(2))-methyltransferase RsmD [Verrucomicrobiota bacterium]
MTLRIIGGLFGGRFLKTPKGPQTRPTTSLLRQALFNICQDFIAHARILDLFAGSGAIGFEAISRGASFVTFVERDKRAAACIRENAVFLQVEPQVQILSMDASLALSRLLSPYDFIYIDPPYDLKVEPLIALIVERKLLAPRGLLFLEERYKPKAPPPAYPGLDLIESRRYGIAHLHQFRLPILDVTI